MVSRSVRASLVVRLATLLALTGCAAPPSLDEEGLPARRADVTRALYRQLDLVLSERHVLAADDPAVAAEHERLSRLADEIALRIVRVDPDVDLAQLQRVLTGERAAG